METREAMIRQAVLAIDSENNKNRITSIVTQIYENCDREMEEMATYILKWPKEQHALLNKKITELEGIRKHHFISKYGNQIVVWVKLKALLGMRVNKDLRMRNIFDVDKAVQVYTQVAQELDAELATNGADGLKNIQLTRSELKRSYEYRRRPHTE